MVLPGVRCACVVVSGGLGRRRFPSLSPSRGDARVMSASPACRPWIARRPDDPLSTLTGPCVPPSEGDRGASHPVRPADARAPVVALAASAVRWQRPRPPRCGASAVPARRRPAATASADDEQALAERYAPVVRLVSSRPRTAGRASRSCPPTSTPSSGNDTVALRGPWDTDDLVKIAPTADDLGKGLTGYHLDFPGNPLSPGCSYEEWADEQTAGSTPTTYARVVTEPGRDGLAVQYWLYYPFNDFTNKHESDWEMIQVEFAASDAATALDPGAHPGRLQPARGRRGRAAGATSSSRSSTAPTRWCTPRPGSHANYYDAALFLGRSGQQGFGCDDTRAPGSDLRPAVALVPSDAAAVGAAYPWLDYTGRWGQREKSFYNGPTGPNTKDQWTAPLTWTDTEGVDDRVRRAGQRAVRHPGDQRVLRHRRPAARRLLRVAMNNPALAALALRRARRRHPVAGAPHDLVARPPRCGWRAGAAPARSSPPCGGCTCGRVLLFAGIGAPDRRRDPAPRPGHRVDDVDGRVRWAATRRSTASVVAVAGLVLVLLSPITLSIGRGGGDGRRRARSTRTAPVGIRSAYRGALRRAVPLLLTQAGDRRRAARLLTVTVVLIPVAVVGLVLSLLDHPGRALRGDVGVGGRAPQRAPGARALAQGRGARRPDQRAGAGRRARCSAPS